LFDHISQLPPPTDAFTTQSTLKYLEACNKLFERGLLSHAKIRSKESEALSNIQKGFSFFSKWLESLFDEGM
jgi:hypothetical protein